MSFPSARSRFPSRQKAAGCTSVTFQFGAIFPLIACLKKEFEFKGNSKPHIRKEKALLFESQSTEKIRETTNSWDMGIKGKTLAF